MADFSTSFQQIEESLRQATSNVMNKFDQVTFKMLINCLKSPDYQVVVDTLEQLEREKRDISIPPIFFLTKSHPDPRIRAKAKISLKKLDPQNLSAEITKGLSPEESVKILISKYGNFRQAK